MKFAYADPPYIGQAKNHYANDPRCAEVDYQILISELEKYDAWALSLSSPTLKQILALCPDGTRIAAWVKPFCSFKPNVNPAYAWEPVIYKGARPRSREERTIQDFVSESITLKKGVHGKKPENFCYWLFELMNLKAEDELIDFYPGSGGVTRAWVKWRAIKRYHPTVNVPDYLEDQTLELLDIKMKGGDGK